MKKHLFCATLLATTILAGNALAECIEIEGVGCVPASGECGPNCTFTYDGETLHVSGPETGEGSIESYAFGNWHDTSVAYALIYASNQRIVIDGNITSIADDIFGPIDEGYFLTGVTSLTIPESVTSIGDFVLASMNNLTTLTIPEKLSENLDLASSIDDYSYARALMEHQENNSRAQYEEFFEGAKAYYGDQLSDEEIHANICENTGLCIEDVERLEAELEAAAEALRNKVASLTINCIGDANVCKQNILNALPQEYKDALGDHEPFIFAGATSGSDDASALAKKYHGTPLLSGKKIYTVQEAEEALGDGTKFHVGLTYK